MTEDSNISRSNKIFGIEKMKNPKFSSRKIKEGRWTREEHSIFISEVLRIGIKNWKKVFID